MKLNRRQFLVIVLGAVGVGWVYDNDGNKIKKFPGDGGHTPGKLHLSCPKPESERTSGSNSGGTSFGGT